MKSRAVVIRVGIDAWDIRAVAVFDDDGVLGVGAAKRYVEARDDIDHEQYSWHSECTDEHESYSYWTSDPDAPAVYFVDVVTDED